VASASNIPGARWGANSWVDASGNFWIFGGLGFDSTDTNGLLNDLWNSTRPQTNGFGWARPASSSANQNGIYGTQGTAAAANAPGGRQSAAILDGQEWKLLVVRRLRTRRHRHAKRHDKRLYGNWISRPNNGPGWLVPTLPTSTASTARRELLPPRTHQGPDGEPWLGQTTTAISGSTAASDSTQPVPVSSTIFGSTRSFRTSAYPTANQWTWVKGANTNSNAGVYGNASVPLFSNVPVPVGGAGYWIDTSNQSWIFGGQGYASSSEAATAYSTIFGASCRIRDFEHCRICTRSDSGTPFVAVRYRTCLSENARCGISATGIRMMKRIAFGVEPWKISLRALPSQRSLGAAG